LFFIVIFLFFLSFSWFILYSISSIIILFHLIFVSFFCYFFLLFKKKNWMVENFASWFFWAYFLQGNPVSWHGTRVSNISQVWLRSFSRFFFFSISWIDIISPGLQLCEFCRFFFSRGYSNLISQVTVGRVDSRFFFIFFLVLPSIILFA